MRLNGNLLLPVQNKQIYQLISVVDETGKQE